MLPGPKLVQPPVHALATTLLKMVTNNRGELDSISDSIELNFIKFVTARDAESAIQSETSYTGYTIQSYSPN